MGSAALEYDVLDIVGLPPFPATHNSCAVGVYTLLLEAVLVGAVQAALDDETTAAGTAAVAGVGGALDDAEALDAGTAGAGAALDVDAEAALGAGAGSGITGFIIK